jgi:hypothetical protein
VIRSGTEQVDHAVEFGGGQVIAVKRGQDLGLVAGRQPDQGSRGGGPEQSQSQIFARGIGEHLDQGEPATDPALVASQQFGDLELAQSVVADQGMNDPGIFPLLSATSGLVEPVDGGLGGAFIGLPGPGTDGLPAEGAGGGQPLEPIEDLVGLIAETDDQR